MRDADERLGQSSTGGVERGAPTGMRRRSGKYVSKAPPKYNSEKYRLELEGEDLVARQPDLKTGKPIQMTGGYDEMSDRSYPDYPGGTSRQRAVRNVLRRAMEAEGFSVYSAEWWHFDYKDWRLYRIGNQRFEDLNIPR